MRQSMEHEEDLYVELDMEDEEQHNSGSESDKSEGQRHYLKFIAKTYIPSLSFQFGMLLSTKVECREARKAYAISEKRWINIFEE